MHLLNIPTVRPTVQQKSDTKDTRASFLDSASSSSDPDQGREDDIATTMKIRETQLPAEAASSDSEASASSFSGDGDEDAVHDGTHPRKKTKIVRTDSDAPGATNTSRFTTQRETMGSKERDTGIGNAVRKAAKKVNEAAHANYRRLKIRSKGSRGGAGNRHVGRRR